MKPLSYFLPLLLLSCTKETPIPTRTVTFHLDGIRIETRATLAEASMTDLWVFEGTTLLKHQTSSDTDFGSPKVTLDYGSHDLTFITSASEGQTQTNGVWSQTRLKDTFSKVMNVTVSSTSSKSRQVELSRRIAKIEFATTDLVPTTVTKCHIKAHTCKSLTASLQGSDAYDYESTATITSKQGQTFSSYVTILPSSPTEEEDCLFLVEFLDATGTALYSYERILSVKPNRSTKLTGAFFQDESATVSVSTSWDTAIAVDLFPE